MIEIRAMEEDYIHIDCLHHSPVDPSTPPRRGDEWQDAHDLPPHPWSDDVIMELAKRYRRISEGWAGEPAEEFMREMIQRHGSCAMLAWEHGKVIGQLRFYPLSIAQLLVKADSEKQHLVAQTGAMRFESEPGTLWVQCVMTCRPYTSFEETIGRDFPPRRGIGLKLVKGLISWAGKREWRRIVKQAHADLDCLYGQFGGGGRGFWEKAGFSVIGEHYDEWPEEDEWKVTVDSQAQVRGLSQRDAWTWYHMAYDLPRT